VATQLPTQPKDKKMTNVLINGQAFDQLMDEVPVVAARAVAQAAFDRTKATAAASIQAAADLEAAKAASEAAIETGGDAVAAEEALEKAQRAVVVATKVAASAEAARIRTNGEIRDAIGESCLPAYALAVKARLQACRDFDAATALMAKAESGWKNANLWIGYAQAQGLKHGPRQEGGSIWQNLKGFEAEREFWERNVAPLPGVDFFSA
jgi:hypothetical protein